MKRCGWVVLLAPLLVLSACQAPSGVASEGVEKPAVSTEAPEVLPELENTSPEPELDQPAVSLLPCSAGTREAIESTVVGQVDAFSQGDFESAYAFASPVFQAGMPLEVFGTLIRINYPQLLEASNARSGPCDADEENGVSTIVMRFDTPSESGYTLRYILEYVDDRWRISGAAEEEIPDTVA